MTTILDAAAPSFVVREIRRHLSGNNPGPPYLALGPFLGHPDGYGTPGENRAKTKEEVDSCFDFLNALKTHGLKLPIERGWNQFGKKTYPCHSQETLTYIKACADRFNLPIFVHATCEEDLTTALNLGVHALAHTITARKKKLSDDFIDLMKATSTYQMSTLQTMDGDLTYYDADNRLSDPLTELVVPEEELTAAKDISKWRAVFVLMMNLATAKPPAFEGGIIDFARKWPRLSHALFLGQLKMVNGKRVQEKILENSKDAILRLHRAGVPVIMGSDTAYSPSALYSFHGPGTLREIELLGESGLTPMEAIQASTTTPAKMLGILNETGTVEKGKIADLNVLKENPLNNLKAFRSIQWTIKDGLARTPAEWMKC